MIAARGTPREAHGTVLGEALPQAEARSPASPLVAALARLLLAGLRREARPEPRAPEDRPPLAVAKDPGPAT
jgi:hypothetical protein